MKVLFKIESKYGNDEFEKEFTTAEEFEAIVEKQRQHYRDLARMDRSITAYASVVKDGQVVYFDQLV